MEERALGSHGGRAHVQAGEPLAINVGLGATELGRGEGTGRESLQLFSRRMMGMETPFSPAPGEENAPVHSGHVGGGSSVRPIKMRRLGHAGIQLRMSRYVIRPMRRKSPYVLAWSTEGVGEDLITSKRLWKVFGWGEMDRRMPWDWYVDGRRANGVDVRLRNPVEITRVVAFCLVLFTWFHFDGDLKYLSGEGLGSVL